MFEDHTVWKVSKYGVFSGPYFPPYSVQMQENTDQKNSVFGHFSRSAKSIMLAFTSH